MLDDRLPLKRFAQELAKRNLERVFFTRLGYLGHVVIEDYLQRQDRPLWKKGTYDPVLRTLPEELNEDLSETIADTTRYFHFSWGGGLTPSY